MKRSLLKRYLPLAAVLAVQLAIIAITPSRQPAETAAATGGGLIDGGSPYRESTDPTGADGTPDAGGPGTTDGTGGDTGPSAVVGPGGTGPTGATTSGGSAGGPGQGDTSHCVDGRQFDPAIDFYAPPCVPKWTGANNGGATYQGVTANAVRVIRYYGKGNDAVDAILRAQGTFVSPEDHRAYQAVVEPFINEHYELYGRQVELSVVEGTCETIPPDVQCLRNEMRQLVEDHQPYFVYWNTSLCSACFDELSRLRTPNAGGWHFRDGYFQARRPYHWDVMMSGTRIAQHAGRWYCAQLHGRPVKYAGTGNPTENMNGRPHLLGVISTNDPENQATVEVDLARELARCGSGFGDKKYFYAQDITTADQQRRAAVLRMRQARGHGGDSSPATSIMCFCDLVAPIFLYNEEQTQNYYPENLVVGTGFMDRDASSQPYMGPAGCPFRNRPCNFEDAFGLSSINAQEPDGEDVGTRVWRAGGGQGQVPMSQSIAASAEWDYLNMIASLLQGAGPNLNPQNMEAGAFAAGFRGGGDNVLRGFSPGNYAWNQDMRLVYWSTTKTSPYNGEEGTYIPVVPGRIAVDGWRPSELVLPEKPR